ncbi:MAG: hypothetical protein WKF88_03095 [Ferruginibacter sp.]
MIQRHFPKGGEKKGDQTQILALFYPGHESYRQRSTTREFRDNPSGRTQFLYPIHPMKLRWMPKENNRH